MTNRADKRRAEKEARKARPHDPRFGPRHPEGIGDGIQADKFEPMNQIMPVLEGLFPGMSVTLIVAEPNSEHDILAGRDRRLNYISNSDRDTMIAVMEEFIRKSKGQQFDPPATRQ